MKTAQQLERIYRVWSSLEEDQIAVRIQFSVEENLYVLGTREEWI